MTHCTCNHQLQPHDATRVCPPTVRVADTPDGVQTAFEQCDHMDGCAAGCPMYDNADHPYEAELYLGGEGG